ncbi:hypothetical protein [Halomicrococcus sp. NG-SE-24]|uniref:hypothetical protein n=1 Tax=Halomicrococcus sp. NG-SE-24 TaxID=3436928 RepID=UPI003D995CEE
MPSLVVLALSTAVLLVGGWAVRSWRVPGDDATVATERIGGHTLPLELAEPPVVAVVRETDDGHVPVVTVLLDVEGDPPRRLVWSTIDSVLDAIHPVFADRRVARYEFQVAYAAPGRRRIRYRRVSVPPSLAERHLDDRDWRRLRSAVSNADDATFWTALDVGGGRSAADRHDAPVVAAAAECEVGVFADCSADPLGDATVAEAETSGAL